LKYGINIMMVTEFAPDRCIPSVCPQWTGLKAANSVDDSAVWWYALVLIALAVVLRLIAVVILVYKSRNFQR
jgi:hypothetical protein